MTLILSGTNGVSDIDGDASTPAIRGTDANTGIFFPAADTIAFAEGGAEVARFDTSGNLLVGGTSQSGTANRAAVFSANKFGLSIIDTTAQTTGVGGALNLGGNYRAAGDAQAFTRVAALKENSTDANYAYAMGFYTTPNGGGFEERARITGSGRMGVGTSSPTAILTVSGTDNSTFGQLNVTATGAGADAQISFSTPSNGRGMYVDDSGSNAFKIYTGSGRGAAGEFVIDNSGNVTINGSLSKSSGSFRIPHPIKPETHELIHSFVESPQADNIYRGKVELVNGRAEVNIDTVAGMTEGTFVALNREVQCFTSNESDWDAVRGSVSGNILTIECQNAESTATISWLVIGERQDQHMYDTDWTDENGKVIVEPLKFVEETTQSTEETEVDGGQ